MSKSNIKVRKELEDGRTVSAWRVHRQNYATKSGEAKTAVSIKRWVRVAEGEYTTQSYPPDRFAHVRNNDIELEKFVRRLNAEQFKEELAVDKILDRMAFLNHELMGQYLAYLQVHLTSPEKIREEMSLLKRHVIEIFTSEYGLTNPKDWYQAEDKWYGYVLTDKRAPKSASSKSRLVWVINRFFRWLYKNRRDEMPLILFDNLPGAKLQNIERDRESSGNKKIRRNIPDADWKKIRKALDLDEWHDIRPWAVLCYDYGLRRSESLGLTFEGADCVYEDGLELKKQLTNFTQKNGAKYGKLKTPGRNGIRRNKKQEKRNIPHWLNVDPSETAGWIEDGKTRLMAPADLTRRWGELMAKLGLDYDIHELRHTWITRAREKYESREVQLAAGHASIETTEGYSHDHREFGRKRVKPSSSRKAS